MKVFFAFIFIVIVTGSCKSDETGRENYPSRKYHYVVNDISRSAVKKMIYVPVYSDIYFQSGAKKNFLTATLSIRNISFTDSFYVRKVDYSGSQGELIGSYIDSAILVTPMASIEFIVEEREKKGGASTNFVVAWNAEKIMNEPLIQAVMTSTQYGVSFITQGTEIK
jgi:hypothetical protein